MLTVSFKIRAGLVAAALILSAAPAAAQEPMILATDPAPLVAITDGGEKSFAIEIADDTAERSRGLMFRQTMGDAHGMLFVFEQSRPVGFWMKNTPMPLDLLFVGADGKVKAILPGEPFSEAPISPGEPVRFVLEVKRGIAAKNGIEDGDRLRHPAIDAVAGNPG
jgi:uncharacterized membrane protein (UPF0127 family)